MRHPGSIFLNRFALLRKYAAWGSALLLLCGITAGVMAQTKSVYPPRNHKSLEDILECYLSRVKIRRVPETLSMNRASAIQERFVYRLRAHLGGVIGYKAALTSIDSMKKFQSPYPILGTLLRDMIKTNGSVIPYDFAARGVCEADLAVRVADESINEATNIKEVLAALDHVYPFLELPDLMYGKKVNPNGPLIRAINAGARLGILGEPVQLEPTDEWIDRLANIEAKIILDDDTVVRKGKSDVLMNNPLYVVLWIRDSLRLDGISLKTGQILSLGTLTNPLPLEQGQRIKAVYTNLDPKGESEVRFRIQPKI